MKEKKVRYHKWSDVIFASIREVVGVLDCKALNLTIMPKYDLDLLSSFVISLLLLERDAIDKISIDDTYSKIKVILRKRQGEKKDKIVRKFRQRYHDAHASIVNFDLNDSKFFEVQFGRIDLSVAIGYFLDCIADYQCTMCHIHQECLDYHEVTFAIQ
jgi:hypothetical protein